jgi:hypothetical protein
MGYNEELLVESFLKRAVDLLIAQRTTGRLFLSTTVPPIGPPRNSSRFCGARTQIEDYPSRAQPERWYCLENRDCECAQRLLFSQTVDWSYDLSNLRIFLELLKHFDVVQGVRPVPLRLLSYIPVLRSIYRVRRRSFERLLIRQPTCVPAVTPIRPR